MTLRRAGTVLVLLAIVMATASAQKSTGDNGQSDKQFQAALQKENVAGDLKGAIEDYRKIAERPGVDRGLAAQALLRMAECYQKLGDAEAQKVYERLVRDFGSQPEAAQARMRLAALRVNPAVPAARSQHPVTTTPTNLDDIGGVSFDGRFLAYTTPPFSAEDEGGLTVRDLATGRDRRVVDNAWFKKHEQVDYKAAFSRDGKQLAYTWSTDAHPELRVVRLDASGIPQPRTLLGLDDIKWITANDWSPDGKWIAVGVIRGDKSSQVGLVSTESGTLAALKSINWDDGSQMSFSPDGKYLAFGHVGSDGKGDILVLAVDGSREIPAVIQPGSDSLIGWSADGRQLIFLSDRTGAPEIWSQAFVGGRFGEPVPLNPRAGAVDFNGVVGLTSSGSLYYAIRQDLSRFDVKTAVVDFASGRLVAAPTLAVPEHVGSNWFPAWSRDGKFLAYVTRQSAPSGIVLAIRAADHDSQPHELRPKLKSLRSNVQWSADGRSLILEAEDFDGRLGLFRVDAQTGDSVSILRFAGNELGGKTQLSRDGSTLYLVRRMSTSTGPTEEIDFALFRRDVTSGSEVQLFRATHPGRPGTVINYAISPDGTTLFYTRPALDPQRPAGGPAAVIARDLSSGVERELAPSTYRDGEIDLSPDGRFIVRNGDWKGQDALLLIPTGSGGPQLLNAAVATSVCWSPDSTSLLMRDRPSSDMWWVPLDQRPRVKLNFGLGDNVAYQFQAHPDGRHVAFTVATPMTGGRARSTELWVLENFLRK